ncbi:MAG: zinc-ribbon domain containing protein [Patescibacteria group bacterium]|nr:zinc-ribbon domain containing protein [Patescibacteria group bacterium]
MSTCPKCQSQFEITAQDLSFYDRVSPTFNSHKFVVPAPTLCPDCRKQRRAAFRNERNLYKRACDLCKKQVVTAYQPGSRCPVYCHECWWSDKWDGAEITMSFNFSRSFTEQFVELLDQIPAEGLFNQNSENSDFTNMAGWNKNCYLLFNSSHNEDSFYSRGIRKVRSSIDLYYGSDDELCYECINCHDCYNLLYSQNCQQCRNSYFLLNCVDCSNCIGCTNLLHKSLFIIS